MSALSCGCDPDYVGEQGYDQGVKGWTCAVHKEAMTFSLGTPALLCNLAPTHRDTYLGIDRTVVEGVPGAAIHVRTTDTGVLRSFATGATRDTAQDKPDYEGFTSPLVTKRFGQYMMVHQRQSDGTLRTSDNWQKGIPFDVYIKSLVRHMEDLKLHHDGYASEAVEADIESVLCALRFNVDGALFEVLKGRR